MKINARQLNLYAVTDRSWLKPGETLVSVTEELLKAGVTCVQLREKHMSDEEILTEASLLKDLCDRYQVPLIINDRPDLAKKSGASGVHVGLSDMGIQKARNLLGKDFIIGGSAHNVEEALAAEAAGADYLGCGAIFGSTTKTNVSQLPIETLKAAETLVQQGFVVLPYCGADPVLCKRLEEVGCAAVMPLGAPIGSNQGLETRAMLEIIIQQATVPVVVDAGIGVPSHAAQALEMGENNACMKCIVAAPTAGSCGVMPAVLLPYQKRMGLSDEEMVRALYIAGAIGQAVATKASIAGAAGGCQYEIGTASAMAAAALCYLGGGDAEAICHAAALAIKSLLGLVCDPIAGLVEVPCIKRNASGAMVAMCCADMALAGIRSAVPPDEVIMAMKDVGDKMDVSLRETGLGGIAGTPSGVKIADELRLAYCHLNG